MLKIHRCTDPVIPDRLVRVDNDRVTLFSEYFESANRLRDVVDAVNLAVENVSISE